MTAAVEVESPPNESVAPVKMTGQVAEIVACLELNVVQSADVRQPNAPLVAVSQAKSLAVSVSPTPAVALVSSEISSLVSVIC